MSVEVADSPTVYVASFYLPDLADRVQKLIPTVKVVKIVPQPIGNGVLAEPDLKILQEEAEVFFCDTHFTKECINNFKRLKWLQAKGAGVDSLMKQWNRENPPRFLVTRLTVNCRLVGEYVLMYVLALERHLLAMYQLQLHGQWSQVEMAETRALSTLTICVLGVGAMGKEVARRCKQLDMRVLGITRSPPTKDSRSDDVDEYRTFEELPATISECDYLCCALPSTAETQDMLSGDVLLVCKEKKPILISVGRGDVIDEASIVTAVRSGWLGGAVLDVFPQEPLPASSPLWSLPNVFITPHLAGYNRNEQYLNSYASEFVENYRRFCKGEKLKNLVDFDKGY